MRHVEIGDMKASVIGLGLWQFGSPQWGWGSDFGGETARAIVNRALDLGINFFDTAELYGRGRSEEIFALALGDRQREAVIATKVSPTHLTHSGVVRAAEGSLDRLGVDAIDLYQVHWPNRFIPLGWTMAGMRELLASGKVHHAGVSNFSLARWQRADLALGRPIAANQVQFHLLDRRPLEDLLPFAQRERRVIIAYSPIAQGLLGGRYGKSLRPRDFRSASPLFSDRTIERVSPLLEELDSVARRHSATPPQIALAWLVHLPNVIAIPGARSVEQVEANAAAADIELTGAEWSALKDLAEGLGPIRGRRRLTAFLGWLLGARP